ncbi:hypothetical protein BVI2075_160058 [Burkholderia vietnamiensis]|nr:hypothetical protein BVI2075_160058 [Burkholderia vietnamiensis]
MHAARAASYMQIMRPTIHVSLCANRLAIFR